MTPCEYLLAQITANAVGWVIGLFIGWCVYTAYEKWIEK